MKVKVQKFLTRVRSLKKPPSSCTTNCPLLNFLDISKLCWFCLKYSVIERFFQGKNQNLGLKLLTLSLQEKFIFYSQKLSQLQDTQMFTNSESASPIFTWLLLSQYNLETRPPSQSIASPRHLTTQHMSPDVGGVGCTQMSSTLHISLFLSFQQGQAHHYSRSSCRS